MNAAAFFAQSAGGGGGIAFSRAGVSSVRRNAASN
jgi:hypothetical protein